MASVDGSIPVEARSCGGDFLFLYKKPMNFSFGGGSLCCFKLSLDSEYWIFDIRYSIFDIQYSTFDIRYSIFNIRYSMFDI